MNQPLVLLPGLLCDAALWEPQLSALADVARFWVPDLTGYESMKELGESVLRDAPWQEFTLAGLSMGGYVALEVMRQAPQRVTRLALLDTRARPETPEETDRRRQLMKLAQTERGFTPVTSRMLPLMLHPSRVKDTQLTKTIREMAERTGVEGYLRQQRAIISRPDFRPGLAKIECPALVLCGRQDQLTPLECSEEMAAQIPGAKLVVVEECGHLSTLERPAVVNAALRGWLVHREMPQD
ncbi:MAG TPA: alpha/beta fold hydrolase [Burkholderiales bacterium]|nr:alpha/beta fold hydrolase [Burkholderiales bacterium]